jgi:hypothetical protein
MGDKSLDRRRYSDREMALILKRAAELQEQGPGTATREQSHTLAELEQVAAEVGIDPRYVSEAADAVDTEPTAKRAPLIGAPITYQVNRYVDGEVPESEFAQMLDAIRQVTGRHGEVNRVLGALEWKSTGLRGDTYITVSPRQGKTGMAIRGQYGLGAGIVYGAVGVVGAALLVGTSVSTGSAIDVGTLAAVGAGTYLAARTAWQVVAARTERRLRKVLEEVTLKVVQLARYHSSNETEDV